MESGDSKVINVILMPVLGVGVATHYKVWHRQNTSGGKHTGVCYRGGLWGFLESFFI